MSVPYKYRIPVQAPAFVLTDSPEALTGFNRLSARYELQWTAGARGKPGINADINSATEAVREIADPDFEILGTNGTTALCTYSTSGGVTLTTAGADNDQMILAPHLDTSQTAWTATLWSMAKSVVWECSIMTGPAITTAIVWGGLKLTNTSVIATDNDQVFVRYEAGVSSGVWSVIYSIGGVDVTVVSTVTVALATVYRVKIAIDSDRIARVYINDELIATTTALTVSAALIPYIGVQASGAAAARAVTVHGQAISRAR